MKRAKRRNRYRETATYKACIADAKRIIKVFGLNAGAIVIKFRRGKKLNKIKIYG